MAWFKAASGGKPGLGNSALAGKANRKYGQAQDFRSPGQRGKSKQTIPYVSPVELVVSKVVLYLGI